MMNPDQLVEYEKVVRDILTVPIKQRTVDSVLNTVKGKLSKAVPGLEAEQLDKINEVLKDKPEYVKRKILAGTVSRYPKPQTRQYILDRMLKYSEHTGPINPRAPFLTQLRWQVNTVIIALDTMLSHIDRKDYPALEITFRKLHAAKKKLIYLAKLEKPIIKPSDEKGYLSDMQIQFRIKPGRESLEAEINQAIQDAIQLVYMPLEYLKGKDSKPVTGQSEAKPIANTKPKSDKSEDSPLFPNLKSKEYSALIPVPQLLANHLGRGMKKANRQEAKDQFSSNGRQSVFRVEGDGLETEIRFDSTILTIKTIDQFADQVLQMKNAKVTQAFLALLHYANTHNSAVFRSVPISDIMSMTMKAQKKVNFTAKQRKDFSTALIWLSAITIAVQKKAERVNIKTGKSKQVFVQERGVKVFRLIEEYAVKKQFQGLPKEELDINVHYDKDVLTRVSGQLLPGSEGEFKKVASLYPESLPQMDPNKDEKAMNLGFSISTRFNQLYFKENISWERAYIIDICDYHKTNKQKPSIATQLIKNSLDKLREAGVISGYGKVTNIDSDRIDIYPPPHPLRLIAKSGES